MSDEETRAGANPAELPAPAADDPKFDTEDLLNSLIAECREYVRIIGVEFGDPETDPHVRWQMMERMMELVKTGAIRRRDRGEAARRRGQRNAPAHHRGAQRAPGGGGVA